MADKNGNGNGNRSFAAIGTAFAVFVGAATIGNIQLTQIKENATRIETQQIAELARIEKIISADVLELRGEINAHGVLRGHTGVLADLAAIMQKFTEVETQFRLTREVTDQNLAQMRDSIVRNTTILDSRGPELAVLQEKVRRLENAKP